MNMPLFKFNSSLTIATICSNSEEFTTRCEVCNISRAISLYENLQLSFIKPRLLTEWPYIANAGRYHDIFHQDVVDELNRNGISGLKYHPVKVVGTAVESMPPVPTYYIVEPIGLIDFIIPEDEYYPPCEGCGILKPRRFGAVKKPFQFLEETWDGSNVVRIRNHWQHIFFVDQKFIDILRVHDWHHQVAYGTANRKYESLTFGGKTSPGVGVQDIDSNDWFEKTMRKLNEL
ncbi:hypothetical protein [Rubritalea sp.]|uniref:hypothetical protein n=1 Tax=Rubritalea sp. TaxID=2109375 RepID=UPI003EF39771